MTATLQIVHGGTTVDLSASDYAVSYTPRDAGGKMTVTESAIVRIQAASLAAMQADIRAIDNAIAAAFRRRQTGIGDKVYIKFQESGDSDTYRSEMWAEKPFELPGRTTVLNPTMVDRIFTAETALYQVSWSRRGYWEDDSETELALLNGSGSGTGGRTVRNPHTTAVITAATISFTAADTIADSGSGFAFTVGTVISVRGSASNDGIYTVVTAAAGSIIVNEPIANEGAGASISIFEIDNFVHIDSADIDGVAVDGGAACRIELTNSDAGADLQTVWMGLNYQSEPDDFAHLLEIEDSDTGANTGSALAVNGQYRAYTVTTADAKITAWTIPSETLIKAGSAYFKIIARFFNGNDITDAKLRIKVFYNSQLLYEGPQTEYDDTYAGISRLWREIDTVQLPPYKLEGLTPTDLTFEIWGQSTAGSLTLNLDCLMKLPINGYRKLQSSSGIAQNSVLIDDGIQDLFYQSVSSEIVRDVVAEGSPLQLWPGLDNRIYFIQHSETADTADIDRTMSVKIYYRPRRVTL